MTTTAADRHNMPPWHLAENVFSRATYVYACTVGETVDGRRSPSAQRSQPAPLAALRGHRRGAPRERGPEVFAPARRQRAALRARAVDRASRDRSITWTSRHRAGGRFDPQP